MDTQATRLELINAAHCHAQLESLVRRWPQIESSEMFMASYEESMSALSNAAYNLFNCDIPIPSPLRSHKSDGR